MRLIDADKFEEFIRTHCGDSLVDLWCELVRRQPTANTPLSDCVGDCKSCWKTKLVNAPTVEPVRGEWEVVHGVMTPGGDPLLRCPVCRSKESYHMGGIEMPQHWNFCPNCGCDMRGEKND